MSKMFRLKPLAIASAFIVGAPAILAATDIVPIEAWMGGSYQECLTAYPSQGFSGQKNDTCYIAFNMFQNSAGSASHQVADSKGVTVWIDHAHNNFQKFVKDGSKDGDEQRYLAFAKLLENDGYTVAALTDTFTYTDANEDGTYDGGSLFGKKILVIANPVHISDTPEDNWVDPIQNAYSPDEIIAIKNWVEDGGALLLIADHYPFPGAVDALGKEFGFFMDNGYHFDPNYNDVFLAKLLNFDLAKKIMRQEIKTTDPSSCATYPEHLLVGGKTCEEGIKEDVTNKKTGESKPRTVKDDLVDVVRVVMVALGAQTNSLAFWAGGAEGRPNTIAKGYSYGDGWLGNHPIVRGSSNNESIPYVTSFTGQSFRYTAPADGAQTCEPIMQLGEGTYNLLTAAQDAYFGIDSSDSENNLVTEALTNQKVPKYTAQYLATADKNTNYRTDCNGYLQGATIERGSGRVAVFGEAAMFSAQIAADLKSQMGFNHPLAGYNQQFVLNTVHWLDGTTLNATNANAKFDSNGELAGSPMNASMNALDGFRDSDLKAAVKSAAIEKLTMVIYRKAKDAGLNDPFKFSQDYAQELVEKYQDTPCDKDGDTFKCLTGAVLPDAASNDINAAIASAPKSFAQTYKDSYDGAGSGGCSISNGSHKDPTLPLLAALAAGWLVMKRRWRGQSSSK